MTNIKIVDGHVIDKVEERRYEPDRGEDGLRYTIAGVTYADDVPSLAKPCPKCGSVRNEPCFLTNEERFTFGSEPIVRYWCHKERT